MFDQYFRQILPSLVKPLVVLCQKYQLKPNHLTLIGLLGAMLAACLIWLEHNYWALAIWWLSRLFDGLDGIVARETKQQTEFGGYLDILCDMAAYSLMIVAFALQKTTFLLYWLLILLGYVLCITTTLALSSLLEKKKHALGNNNRSLQMTAGLAEATETNLAYTLFILFPAFLQVWLILWVLVLAYTVLQRTLLARKLLNA